MTTLWLLDNPIADDGAAALARSVQLPNLKNVRFALNNIGPAGARALAESGPLGRLDQLAVQEQRIGSEGEKVLQQRFGAALLFEHDCGDEFAQTLSCGNPSWIAQMMTRFVSTPRELEAAGNPQAELMRLQCELAARPEFEGGTHEPEMLVNNLLALYARPKVSAERHIKSRSAS